MFGIFKRIKARILMASAQRVCLSVRECVGEVYARGGRPITVIGDVSIAVGIDRNTGTVWGVRPENAVSIRHARQIRHDCRIDTAISAVVHWA